MKQEVTSLDRKSELADSMHAQTSSGVLTDISGRTDDDKQQQQQVKNIGGRGLSGSSECETHSDSSSSTWSSPAGLTGSQLHAAAIEYIQLESVRQIYLQMIAASSSMSTSRHYDSQ